MSDWLKQDGITVSSEMDGRASLSRMACPDHHGEELIFTFDWSAEDAAGAGQSGHSDCLAGTLL